MGEAGRAQVRVQHWNTQLMPWPYASLLTVLQTDSPGEGYFQLVADPDAMALLLYRHFILEQTFETSSVTCDMFVLLSDD